METGRRAYGLDVRLSPLAARFARHDLSGHRFPTVIALGAPLCFHGALLSGQKRPQPLVQRLGSFSTAGATGEQRRLLTASIATCSRERRMPRGLLVT
jgi:hypothetical protein